MSDLTRSVRHRPWRAGATALVVCSFAALAACSGGADEPDPEKSDGSSASAGPSSQTSPVPTVSPEPSDDVAAPGKGKDLGPDRVELPAAERSKVVEATDDYLDEVEEKLAEPDAEKKPVEYSDLTGAALETLLNTVSEYDQNGWRVVGRPKVVSQQVVRRTKNPEGLVLRVCIDNSDVKVLDPDGKRVPNSKPASPRTLNVLTLLAQDDAWIVSDQRPAENPDC